MSNTKKRRMIWIAVLVLFVLTGLYLGATHYAGKLVEHTIQKSMGPGFSIGELDLGFTSITAKDVILKDLRRDTILLKVNKISLFPSWTSLLSGKVTIRKILLQSPFIRIEKLANGEMVLPVGAPGGKAPPSGEGKGAPSKKPTPIKIRTLVVKEGTILFLDGSVHPTVKVEMERVNLTLRNLEYPFLDDKILMDFIGILPSKGEREGKIKVQGWTQLPSRNGNIKVTLDQLDARLFSPYLKEKSTVTVKEGWVSLRFQARIKRGYLDAPGEVTIQDLAFSNQKAGVILGLPVSLVTSLLENKGGQLALPFRVKGQMDNPRFSFRETMIRQLAANLARNLLGVPQGVVKKAPGVLKGLGGVIKGVIPPKK